MIPAERKAWFAARFAELEPGDHHIVRSEESAFYNFGARVERRADGNYLVIAEAWTGSGRSAVLQLPTVGYDTEAICDLINALGQCLWSEVVYHPPVVPAKQKETVR